MRNKLKIAYIINHLSFFCSHILPLAEEAKKKGFIVHIFCGTGGSKKMEKQALKIIKKKKFRFSKFNFQPGAGQLLNEFNNIIKLLYRVYLFRPDLVHGITMKAIIISCLYSIIFRPKKLILFITGMGYFFTNKLNFFDKIIKFFILKIIKFTLYLKKSILIPENKDDLNFFINKKKIKIVKILKISGVGVSLKKFNYFKKKKKKYCLISG